MNTQSTPTRPELIFDGFGINGPDDFRTRIATFNPFYNDACKKYGPLFASAPRLLAQNEELRRGIIMAVSALEYPASIEEAKGLLNTTLANNKAGGAS